MLKLPHWREIHAQYFQPPSGGCVLKHPLNRNADTTDNPAAFRRLCVETGGGFGGGGEVGPSRLQAAVC